MLALLLALQISTTNCIGTAYGGMNCTTMTPPPLPPVQYSNDSGTVLGTALGELITGSGDRHVRSQIGKMLAAGNCKGAVQYALQKGRFDLVETVRDYCTRMVPNDSAVEAPAPAEAPAILSGPRRVRAKTASGYCLDVPRGYVGTGAANSPAVSSAMPRCDQLSAR